MDTAIQTAITALRLQRDKIEAAISSLESLETEDVAQPAAQPELEAVPPPARRGKRGRPRAAAPAEPAGSKPCNRCGDTKAIDDFPRNHQYADGHTNVCKECTNARVRELKDGKKKRP